MLTIMFNQKPLAIEAGSSLATILQQQGQTGRHFAVALNQQFIARKYYAETLLNEGDVIDILLPMQGG